MDFPEDAGNQVVETPDDADAYRVVQREYLKAQAEKKKPKKEEEPKDDGVGKKIADFFGEVTRGALRGTITAANETAKTLNTVAVATGAMKKEDTGTASPDSFIETFTKPLAEDEIDERLGKRPEGVAGFVELATQFAVGMVGVGKFIKPAKAVGFVGTAVKGAVVDMTAFDPFQQRLSNMVQNGPSWLQNPVTEFLAADADDSAVEARVKAGLEGLLTGYTIDRFVAGLKVTKKALRAKTPEAKAAVVAEAKQLPDVKHDVAKHGPVVVRDEAGEYTLENAEKKPLSLTLSKPAEPPNFVATREGIVDAPKFATQEEAEALAASMNGAWRNARQPRANLTPEQITLVQARAAERTPVLFGKQVKIEGADFNFNYSVAPDEAKKVINAISEVLPEPTVGLTNRTANELGQSHAETVKLAEGLLEGMNGDQIVDAISKAFDNTERLPQLITATRTYLYGLGKKVSQLSRAADAMPDNPVAFNELKSAMDNLWETHSSLAGTSSNIGRALEAHKIKVGTNAAETAAAAAAEPVKLAKKTLDGMSKQELRALARQVVMTEGDATEIIAAMRASKATQAAKKDPTLMEKINSFRIEAMLSGQRTQEINVVNNAIVAFQMPVEYWWAGKGNILGMLHLRKGNEALRQQGADQLVGLRLEAREAWRAAGKAFRTGSNALDEAGSVISDAGIRTGSSMMNGVSVIGHLPSRLLMTEDEFFKTLSYRSSVRAQSLRLARESGIADPAELGARVADDMKAAFTLEGRATHPVALQYARTATFQNPLEYGIGKWIQEGVQEHPALRLVMPFVRTPVNLFRYAWQRTPGLNRFTREWQADIAAGGDRAAIAQAKTEMGMLTYTTAAGLALSGNITGAGPSNPELRKQWLAAGNQPYSIKVPFVGWMSYRRGDPSMIPLGLVADLVNISGELQSDEITEHASAIAAAVASNISSKTFMQGVTETMDAISSGDGFRMEKLIQNTTTSFIPNFFRQTNPDDTLRETRTMVDEVMGRLPGFSNKLEPRRNILGEPILRPPSYVNRALNPFTFAPGPGDMNILDQLVELGKAMSMPSEMKGKVNLTERDTYDNGTGQSPYDRMNQLVGTAREGEPNLRAELTEKMRSQEWTEANDGTTAQPGGRRYLMAARVITKHQDRAFRQVLEEYPKLKNALGLQRRVNRAAVVGGESEVDRVTREFELP